MRNADGRGVGTTVSFCWGAKVRLWPGPVHPQTGLCPGSLCNASPSAACGPGLAPGNPRWVDWGGFGMSPLGSCRCRRLLADRRSRPFPWTLSLHRRRCPWASHHLVPPIFLLGLSFPLYFPFLFLGLSLCRPWCPSASNHFFPFFSSGLLHQRSPRTFTLSRGEGGGAVGGQPAPTSETLSSGKNEFYFRGRKFEADVRYTNFFGL